MNPSNIHEIESGIPPPQTNAVSVYSDGIEDFPVLKAFQQYIDAEQTKARKRMLILCVFFGGLMTLVIVVFLAIMLRNDNRHQEDMREIRERNQQLTDRLIAFAVNQNQPAAQPVVTPIVVQQPQPIPQRAYVPAEDQFRSAQSPIVQIVTNQVERNATSVQELVDKRVAEAIQAFNQKEKAEEEKKRKHDEEVEAWRRKIYPDSYARQTPPTPPSPVKVTAEEEKAIDDDLERLLAPDDELTDADEAMKPISYFEGADEAKESDPAPVKTVSPDGHRNYTIPVEVKGKVGNWLLPKD